MPETTDKRLEYLFDRYFEKTATKEEEEELMRLINLSQYDEQLKYLMDQVWSRLSPAYCLNDKQSGRILSGIIPPRTKVVRVSGIFRRNIIKWSVAAATILAVFAGEWIWHKSALENSGKAAQVAASKYKNDLTPGGNKAILMLANGSSVALGSVQNGIVAQQGNMQIEKLNGQLSYREEPGDGPSNVQYNMIITPRGGQYQVILADGSKVWLNAGSSLRFPTTFTGKERSVELTGEAYFEVAENKNMPFLVKKGDVKVQVLGTHFNVKAYDDDPGIKITLLEGSVKVGRQPSPSIGGGDGSVILKPGQQATVSHSGDGNIKVAAVNMAEAIAWKNGLFFFSDTDIQCVMRQIARWYNADIVYTGNVNARLNGMISRNTDLSRVLQMLELTGEAHFKIEGKKIMVMP